MSDNVVSNATTTVGTTWATDDVSGVQYPRSKISWGVDGSAVDASASNPFPVVQTGTATTKETRSSTATTSQVSDTASSTTLLAANANRLGAIIFNDSSALLLMKCGTTATSTDYTVQIPSGFQYSVEFGYTGRIDGIWLTDPNDGGARVTEFT